MCPPIFLTSLFTDSYKFLCVTVQVLEVPEPLALVTCLGSRDVTGIPCYWERAKPRQAQETVSGKQNGNILPTPLHIPFKSPFLFVLPAWVLISVEEKGRLELTLGRLGPCPSHTRNRSR